MTAIIIFWPRCILCISILNENTLKRVQISNLNQEAFFFLMYYCCYYYYYFEARSCSVAQASNLLCSPGWSWSHSAFWMQRVQMCPSMQVIKSSCFIHFLLLGIKPRALHMLGKCVSMELPPALLSLCSTEGQLSERNLLPIGFRT